VTERFAIAVPAYDAAATVAGVVRRAHAICPDVLVVDDGSADGTGDAARAAGARVLVHDRNLGKGRALRTAFGRLFGDGFDAVITMDADAQHPPEEATKLVAAWHAGADLVLGTRHHLFELMGVVRRASNASSSWIISKVAGSSGRSATGFSSSAFRCGSTSPTGARPPTTGRSSTRSASPGP
jgi:glycosyltransferase involved in cell wall biosynthesis